MPSPSPWVDPSGVELEAVERERLGDGSPPGSLPIRRLPLSESPPSWASVIAEMRDTLPAS
jgi:hypothetical protein